MEQLCHVVETWKPIVLNDVKIKPYYWVSNMGRVYGTYYNKFIIPHQNHSGYLQVSLMAQDGGRIFRKVHRLVLLTFNYIDGCEALQVNHKDVNKSNNCIGNLEWVTPKENIHHAILNNCRSSFIGNNNPMRVINEKDALEISNLLINGYSDQDIANMFSCSLDVVRGIAFGKTWTYLFDDITLNKMKKLRKDYSITEQQKHDICKFYQLNSSNYIRNYGKAKRISQDALLNTNIPINDTNIRIARRLYFRLQNPEITNLYIY